MREGVHAVNEEKPFSHIVNRGKAWPAASTDHPIASGLTVRQQAHSLGKTSLAHQEEQLAQRYGAWEQELRSFVSCSGPEAQKLSMQADALMAQADDAMTPRVYTTGPV